MKLPDVVYLCVAKDAVPRDAARERLRECRNALAMLGDEALVDDRMLRSRQRRELLMQPLNRGGLLVHLRARHQEAGEHDRRRKQRGGEKKLLLKGQSRPSPTRLLSRQKVDGAHR